ncbi:hypothetical protein [Bacillus cereus]|uniref:hypothetical protein n=1 Tax=Bacillus cereus TaxID=1396 RepID=UPI0015E7F031|nr:hypothetical protein [Bacillus cereus]
MFEKLTKQSVYNAPPSPVYPSQYWNQGNTRHYFPDFETHFLSTMENNNNATKI